MKALFTRTSALAISLALAATGSAQAQIEEITVTARKRAESLQDIPLTVNAFTNLQLEERGISDLNDLASFTPGLSFLQPVSRSSSAIFFRGVAQVAGVGDTRRDTASIFVDGIYYVGSTSTIGFEDLERIEVVKGPQSAFYGRATFSGAINFITATPSAEEFRGTAFIKAAEHDEYEFSGSVEGPIIPGILAARLSASHDEFGGEHTNILTGKKLGQQEDDFAAITLQFTPVETVSARLRMSYTDQKDSQPASALVGRVPVHNCGPFGGTNNGGPATLRCGEIEAPATYALNDRVFPETTRLLGVDEMGFDREYFTTSFSADWDFYQGYTISSLTGYQYETQSEFRDFELTPLDVYHSDARRRQGGFSQEVRLASPEDDRFTWLVGGYYFLQEYRTAGTFIFASQNPFLAGRPAGTGTVGAPQDTRIENQAVFGAASFDITDQLTASAEVRWAEDTVGTPLANRSTFEFTTRVWLPRFILEYQPTDDVTLYVNAAKGDQPTQGNSALLTLPANQAAIANAAGLQLVVPESVLWSYEVGAKTTWLDGRLRANVAAFYTDWKDKQGVRSFLIDLNQDGRIDTRNSTAGGEIFNAQAAAIGDVEVWGVEFDGAFQVTDALTFGGQFAYATQTQKNVRDNLYFRFFGTDLVPEDNQEAGVPEWSAAAYGEYRQPLFSDFDGFLRTDVVYVGTRYASILNVNETGESYDVNVKLGIENETWRVTLFVDNLFDDDTPESLRAQSDSALDPAAFRPAALELAAPRGQQFGITASVKFGFAGEDAPARTTAAAPAPAPTPAPAPAPAPAPVAERNFLVFFDFDQAAITAQASDIIDQAVATVKAGGSARLMVTGHADRSGSVTYNQRLSESRAAAVQAELTRRGIAASAISTAAKGESDPLVDTADGVREPSNRRVEIVID